MKFRLEFVTNSSSASFVISKHELTVEQLDALRNHIDVAKSKWPDEFDVSDYDEWGIEEDEDFIKGFTAMDNFDMGEFMERIGIDSNKAEWDDYF